MRMKKLNLMVAAAMAAATAIPGNSAPLEVGRNSITLDFSSYVNGADGQYVVKRSTGRVGDYKIIGRTTSPRFTDRKVKGNPYNYYYVVLKANGDTVASLSATAELFGPDVWIYGPSDKPEAINREINRLHDGAGFGRRSGGTFHDQMGKGRYALLFEPGDYTAAGEFRVGFYTHMAGLGKVPYDVKISNVQTPPPLRNDNGTCTFWRSVENFSVIGPESYEHEKMFNWAVSQAAPYRRMYSQRTVRNQWKHGWVSGGFTADSRFDAPVGSDGQQQWFTRNSFLNQGRGRFAEGAYNFVFVGDVLGDKADLASYADADWDRGGNVTFVPTTPVVREKPFLFIGDDGRFKVFRPAIRRDSKGISYTETDMGEGTVIDLLDNFFVARPGVSTRELNENLAAGKHLLFTPGMFELTEPLHITLPNTLVMGLGWSTIVPPEGAEAGILVDDVDGVQIAAILLDAWHSSNTMLKIGHEKTGVSHAENPVVLSDIFLRIGGFVPKKVEVQHAVEINSNNVVGDHFWIWRADHGVRGSVGWDINKAKNGLLVNGDDVTIYGLFNEHFQEYQTLWLGENGNMYFYQCETPYDAPNQEVFMSENGTRPGYAAYKIGEKVRTHSAYGLGIYDVLHRDIMFENSIEAPDHKGINIHHMVNTSFIPGPKKGFNYVINGTVGSTYPHAKQYVARKNHFSGTK